MTLSEFLAARLADDEQYVHVLRDVGERLMASGQTAEFIDGEGFLCAVMADPQARQVIERFGLEAKVLPPNDLDRVLREVEAKRKILALWETSAAGLRSPRNRQRAETALPAGQALRLLATVYSTHPDYDPSWRPEQ